MKQRFEILTLIFILPCFSVKANAQVPLGNDVVLAVFPPGIQAEYTPAPACDDTGVCALFWSDARYSPDIKTDIFGATVSSQGQILVPPRLLVTKDFASALLAVGLEKGFAVFWDLKFPDGYTSPVLQYYDQSLIPDGAAIRLPFKGGGTVDDPNYYGGFSSVVRTPSGFVLYTNTLDNPRAPVWDVFVYFVDRSGNEIRPRAQVNAGRGTNSNTNIYRGLAVQPNGDLVAVYWRGGASNDDVYMRRLNSAGQPLGPETLVNTVRHRVQSLPAVAAAPDGSYMVVWQSAPGVETTADILARRFSAKGKPLGPPFQVNNIHNLDQRFPIIAADARGNFFVTWQSFAPKFNWDVKGRWFRQDGTPLGDEVRLNQVRQFEQYVPNLTISPDGTAIVGWESAALRQRGVEGLVPVARVFAPAP